MLRAVITGTIATAATEQAAAHGLGVTPDAVLVMRRTNAAGASPSIEKGDVGAILGYDANSVYTFCVSANTLYTALALAWQGRSY